MGNTVLRLQYRRILAFVTGRCIRFISGLDNQEQKKIKIIKNTKKHKTMKYAHNSMITVSAVLTGIAIGSVIGILFAPAKGRDTRKKLCRKMDEADDLTESLKEKFNKMVEEVKNEMEIAKEKAQKSF